MTPIDAVDVAALRRAQMGTPRTVRRIEAESRTPGQRAWRRLSRDGTARFAGAVLLVLVVITALAPLFARYAPNAILDSVKLKDLPPSATHWFGTDAFSRDVFSRVLYGGRISLTVALLSSVVAATLGTWYGAVAGFRGGIVDTVLMRFLDACLSIPRILLLIAIAELWGEAPVWGLIVLLGTTGWFPLARLVRNKVRDLSKAPFVDCARAMGAHDSRILLRHILPNTIGPIIVNTTLGIGNVIVLEAALSYLGIGVRIPHASWGNIIRDGVSQLAVSEWWVAFFPGIAIVISVVAFNLLGDALRDALDPRTVEGQ